MIAKILSSGGDGDIVSYVMLEKHDKEPHPPARKIPTHRRNLPLFQPDGETINSLVRHATPTTTAEVACLCSYNELCYCNKVNLKL